jgi:hypothetical protein
VLTTQLKKGGKEEQMKGAVPGWVMWAKQAHFVTCKLLEWKRKYRRGVI